MFCFTKYFIRFIIFEDMRMGGREGDGDGEGEGRGEVGCG